MMVDVLAMKSPEDKERAQANVKRTNEKIKMDSILSFRGEMSKKDQTFDD